MTAEATVWVDLAKCEKGIILYYGRGYAMSWYRYRAKTLQGKRSTGRLEAESESRAYEAIREQGLFVLQLKKVSEKHITKPLGSRVLAELTGQLAVMLESGVPLLQGMNILSQKERDEKTASVFRDIYLLLLRGYALSEAMNLLNGVFPAMVVNMVKAGETGGELTLVMRQISEYYEKNHRMRKKVESALIYPVFLLTVMFVVMIVLFTTVLPEFFALFDSVETLPVSTRILMRINNFITDHGIALLCFLALASVLTACLSGKESVRYQSGKLLIHLPVVGKLLVAVYTARFARTMSVLYAQGVSMIQVLRLSIDVVGSTYVEAQLREMVQEICEGCVLSAGIAKVDGLDRRLSANIYVGEETGELNVLLLQLAERFEADAEEASKRFAALIEPVMIVILGLVVAAMMIAVMLPMTQYYQGIL